MTLKKADVFDTNADIVYFKGDVNDLLVDIPDNFIQLIITSPPYNLGKEYEKKVDLETYLKQQETVITECVRVLKPEGSICWQVGNYVENGEIIPLDILLFPIFSKLNLQLRNRIVWHFGHGFHASNRFSGRYEVILWFTKTDDYVFNLDPVRVPQKYPQKKYYKGPKKGQLSGNPLGKNPSDVWNIPNVKSNHIEKTEHRAPGSERIRDERTAIRRRARMESPGREQTRKSEERPTKAIGFSTLTWGLDQQQLQVCFITERQSEQK